ncbi:MAG: 50S ribosomal protein L35 [Sphingobacteriales bacterium]|jgi:large subunit ribosomal protein L35|nr:MAG: 50S ribosomal protein L35 [Sphingobacteriales bacterium]
MPKVKTHSRAKKTFKVSATGKIMYRKPYRGHLLTKKTSKRKRAYRIEGEVNKANTDFVKRLLRLK